MNAQKVLPWVAVSVIAAGIFVAFRYQKQLRKDAASALPERSPAFEKITREKERLLAERRRLDETVWSREVLAQEYENTIVRLWDDLRASADPYTVFEKADLGELKLGNPQARIQHPWGIIQTRFGGFNKSLNLEERRQWLEELRRQGYQIIQSEWHHKRFNLDAENKAHSLFTFAIHVAKPEAKKRFIVGGEFSVDWTTNKDARGLHIPGTVDATGITISEREGPPAFEEVTGEGKPIPRIAMGNDNIILYDLNRDGLSEIILPEQNLVYWNKGNLHFDAQKLCAVPAFTTSSTNKQIGAAVVADFNRDGNPDLVIAGNQIGVVLFEGDAKGHFSQPGRTIMKPTYSLNFPAVITAGDINGDGLPDIWMPQIKPAYDLGSMPTPFYDANDGYPAYLLLNEGGFKFREATLDAGLGNKRYRRTFSSSFVDLNGDGALDLIVVSDFSGLDMYLNDGKGHFTDVTKTMVDETANFGMGHVFADFNKDGILDFFVTGMSSTTARRLEHMQLARKEFPDITEMRSKMAYGNRMYLGSPRGEHYTQPVFNDSVARSGWSWGCTAFDVANDGNVDIYVANGNISGKSTKDYCTRYWTQDIYLGNSKPNMALNYLFQEEANRTADYSWNGYEKKVLFMNEHGTNFVNFGFLFDVAFEYDARAIISDDLDGDGRVDLLVLEKQPQAGIVAGLASNTGQRAAGGSLHIYRNMWPEKNNWIGIRLEDEPNLSPIGASVTVISPAGKQIARYVNGDSFESQHSNTKHFGLGKADHVDSIEVKWLNGKTAKLNNPAINQYYLIKPQ